MSQGFFIALQQNFLSSAANAGCDLTVASWAQVWL